MEIAMSSAVASSSIRTTSAVAVAGAANVNGSRSDIVGFFNSNAGGFKTENAITSNNGLAMLASLTLKKALNVGNGYQQQQQKQQQPPPPTAGFMSAPTNVFAFNGGAAAATSSTTTTTKITSSSNPTSSSSSHNNNKGSTAVSVTAITKSSSSSAIVSLTTSKNTASVTTPAIMAAPTVISNSKHNFQIPSDILDDLASRFIINVPDMELSNLIRICFQIELAHWFYLDFFCASDEEKKLQPCGMKQFSMQLFQHIPFLREHLSLIDKILEDWKNYKLSVPTFGGILISEDLNYCLLVQSYFAKCSWGFPKGKVNENEDPEHCAAREVYEETGYDITELIVPNDYIEAVINYQKTRLYIVRNVSLQTQFSPRTRNEIKCCDWFPIDSLPINKNDAISKAKLGINANSFFMIMPFVKRLKKWVNERRAGIETRRKCTGGGGGAISPTTNSPLTANALTTTVAHVGGNYTNNNQKHSNASNSCKKNKQKQHNNNNGNTNNNDDKNALRNDTTTTGGVCSSNAANELANSSTTAATAIVTTTSSNRSKRQRHKSMGDLDGIKLNNLSHNNNQSNCKSTVTTLVRVGATTTVASTSATIMPINAVNANNNSNVNNTNVANSSNHKRNSAKIVAAGSNVNTNTNINNNSNSQSTTKRQLFHSQSQNGAEKVVSSFDLIRKEKQQLIKAAAQAEKAAKAQKQQQQQQPTNGRVRAKSQGDKMCTQLQQQQATQQSNKQNSKQRAQKQQQQQQTIIINNSAHANGNANANNNGNSNNNNGINTSNKRNSSNLHISTAKNVVANVQSTLPSAHLSGADLIALAKVAGVTATTPHTPSTATQQINGLITPKAFATAPHNAQRPRPSSVSLLLATTPTTSSTSADEVTMQQLQRMASGTNLRILRRATSHQPTQHQAQMLQQQHQQHQPLKFTPSFNSWTNFSFTKNFITNVFC